MTQIEAIILIPLILIPIALTFMSFWFKNLPLSIASGIAWMALAFLPALGVGSFFRPDSGPYWAIRAVCFATGLTCFLYMPIVTIRERSKRIEEEWKNRPVRKDEEEEYSDYLDQEIEKSRNLRRKRYQ